VVADEIESAYAIWRKLSLTCVKPVALPAPIEPGAIRYDDGEAERLLLDWQDAIRAEARAELIAELRRMAEERMTVAQVYASAAFRLEALGREAVADRLRR
jgi:hypothetical protein